jgi:signal transduction histidine kinase/ActR/RegA family two-component response regulator
MTSATASSSDQVPGSRSSVWIPILNIPAARRPVTPAPPTPARATRSRPQHLLDLAVKISRAAWGGIWLFAADGELIDHITSGLGEDKTLALCRSSAAVEFFYRMLQSRAPTRGRGLTGAEAPWSVPELPASDAYLALPLTSLGRHRGVLYVVRGMGQSEFQAHDEELLLPIGTCLDQANLFEESHLLAQLRLLNHVIQAAAGNLDLSRILSVALRELDRNLPLHRGAVWLLEDEETPASGAGRSTTGVVAAPAAGSDRQCLVLTECSAAFDENLPGLARGARLPLDATPFASCIRDGQAHYADLRGPEARQLALPRNLAENGATAYFAVPMRVGEQAVGVLLSVCQRPSGFTAEQIQLLYLVADLLGPAISNCQLFNRLSSAYEELRRTQSQLIQSEKMRALGELAGGMAHDFNNSLCGLLGFLELSLLDAKISESCRSYLESARACAMDAAQSVSRVQDFARWRRTEEEWQLVDLNEVASKTVELTRPKWESMATLRQAPIAVQVLPEARGMIKGNAAELRNALTNLVLNGIDAMPQGGTLTVRAWNTRTDAFVSVRDTGIGMDEKMRARLFEPFFSTKGERGTGLGLSAAFGIVRRHEGEITVESKPGCGSIFTIRVPLAVRPAAPAPSEPSLAQPAPARSLRILVVDDEEAIRRFLGATFKQLGHHARLTGDAAAALAAFEQEPFDVVITDLGLTGPSGEDVARAIAQRSPQTPVILATGWADQIEAEQKKFEGVTCVLGKPLALRTLMATLEKVTSDKQ